MSPFVTPFGRGLRTPPESIEYQVSRWLSAISFQPSAKKKPGTPLRGQPLSKPLGGLLDGGHIPGTILKGIFDQAAQYIHGKAPVGWMLCLFN